MSHILFRSHVFTSVILVALPIITSAHTDHPDDTAVRTISDVVVNPTILAAAAAVVLTGVVLWIFRGQFIKQAIAVGLVALAITGIVVSLSLPTKQHTSDTVDFTSLTAESITLYKNPNCGCCEEYAAILRQHGFDVVVEKTNDLDAVKADHNIPVARASCHTSVMGDYVVEGHVPLEAVAKLIQEQPIVAGIGLAGMPIGTPGMPGAKIAPYEVYQLSDTGEASPYITI